MAGRIYVGIGGWTFAPWRGTFYPDGLPRSRELAYAASRLTSIEINGTFYRTQTPESFRKWAKETPDGFRFAVKGHRYVTQRPVLAEAGESMAHFLGSGVSELGDKLGPLLWQFGPHKKFEAVDLRGFLELLPRRLGQRRLRHVLEARHPSFVTPGFIGLAREFDVAVVFTDHASYPSMSDVTADFVYLRLQKGLDSIPTAYPPEQLDAWARRARLWAEGKQPDDLPRADAGHKASIKPRDVFIYFIHEGKVRAPAAATALIERVTGEGSGD
jgi:uncharacterized protein YecE (DUF72 family)